MPCDIVVLCGISTCFQVLSPCMGQIAHALLTRPPLESRALSRRTPSLIPARLACVKHAASVRPEPGSNSDVQSLSSLLPLSPSPLAKAVPVPSGSVRRLLSQKSDCFFFLHLLLYCIVFKDRRCRSQPLLSCCPRDNVDDYSKPHTVCQPLFSIFLK